MWKSSITEITINVTNPLNTLLQMHKQNYPEVRLSQTMGSRK